MLIVTVREASPPWLPLRLANTKRLSPILRAPTLAARASTSSRSLSSCTWLTSVRSSLRRVLNDELKTDLRNRLLRPGGGCSDRLDGSHHDPRLYAGVDREGEW